MKKRGLSPIIATLLLITIALIIAIIIFLWAKSFIGEKTTKLEEPIENSCGRIDFLAEAVGRSLNIVNKGNVPLYGVEIRKKGAGTIEDVGRFEQAVNIGETGSISLVNGLNSGEEVIVVPIILGEAGEYKKAYTCGEDYGQEITI